MADGNVGSLFMTLGLKDEISIGLDKVTKKLSSAQKYTDDLQKEVGNLRKELKSASGTDISGPFKKSLEFIKKYDDGIYNAIVRTNRLAYALRGITQSKDGKININLSNIPVAIRELAKLNQELNKIDDKDDKKAFKTSISNATDYLKLLQTIERKKAELNEISLSSRNIDKGVIASARNAINGIQQEISKQLFNIQNGSIINTAIMPEIKKLLSMSITEIGDYMRNLKKDNPLSVFANSADMLTSKIATANKKILEMQSLMRSSKMPNLFDITALNGLKGVVGKMQSLINKEGKGEKTDINKINRLVSEYAKLVSQAELAKSTFKQLSREYDNANARLVSWFGKYRELQSIRNDRIRLGLDTSAIDAEISRVRTLFGEINSIRQGLASGNTNFLGMLGSRGTGVDTALYNSVVKAARAGIAEQEKIDRNVDKLIAKQEKAAADEYRRKQRQTEQRLGDIDKESKARQKQQLDQEQADASEYKRKQRQTEQRLKDIDREGKALQKNAEIQSRLSAKQESSQRKQSNEALREEYRLRDAKLKTLEREAKARMRTQELADKAAADALKKQQRLDIETMQFQAMLNAAIERRMAAQREEVQLEAKKLSSMSSQEEIQRRFVSYMEQMNAMRPKNPLFNQSGMIDLQRIYGKAFDELGVQYDKLKAKIDSYHGPTDNTGFIAWKNELSVIEAKMQNLVMLSEQAARASVSGTYKPYTTTTKEEAQRRMQESNTLKAAIQERMAIEKRAEEQRKEAEKQRRKDEKDAAAAEKQRQRDLEITRTRILSVTRTLEQMRDITNRTKKVGIDTTRLESEVARLTTMLINLRSIRSAIESGGKYSLGNYGNGNSIGESKLLTEEYRKLVNEKEKAIKLEARHQLEIANTAAKVRNDLARAFEQVNTHASKTSDIVRDLKSLFLQGGLVFGAQQFFNSIVRTGGEIVQQHIALRSIIGDIQKADELFAQTQQLALQSPFKFGELNRDVKQLAAFGVEANDLYDTTKRLADIASGLGVSFERLGLAYGQVKARSWLDGKELRQFAYAGLPLLEKITQLYNSTAKNGRTNYTQSDVKKMITNREVSFEDVQTVLWNMTNEGGQFYNMQLVLSETLLGRWNKLIDAWEIMLGKFADGNNVIGGTFKMIIDQVTNLTLALDRLSPVLVAAAAVFVGKKALGLIPMGITKELSALQTATNLELRRYAVKQQELVTEGKITQAKAAQNVMMRGYMLADKQTQIATMQKLALEGKLSLLQMQKAVREGLVKKELIQELEILGLISAKQAELIMQQGMRSTAQLAGMQAMGGIGKGSSALLGAFGGPWGIAAMIGMSLWMGYSQFEDKVKESVDNLKTSAQQKFEQLNNYLNNMGGKPQDNENLRTQVDSMKEVLEQSGYYTDSIKAQVENTIKLTDQYDILKKKIEEARNASKFDIAFAGNARNAVTMSGQTDSWFGTLFGLSGKIGQITDKLGWTETGGVFGWFSGIFNDDIVKNAEQLAESMNKVSSLLMTMDSKKVEEVANQFLSAGDRTKSLEEKLRILRESDSWDGFVKKIIEGGILSENEIGNIGDKADELIDDINEIKDDDVPKIMEELARQRNMELDEFKIWAKDHPIAFGNMLDTIMKTIGDKGPKIKELLYDAFYGFMGMAKPQEPNYNKDTYKNPIKGAFANQIKQKLYSDGTITGTDRIGKYTVKQINTYLQQVDKDTYQETGEAILKNYKQWRNEVDTMETSDVDKNSSKYKRAKWMLDLWDTIRKAGNLSDEVGKNKNTGNFGKEGSQEDDELKRLRKKIELYKKFYSEYRKLQDLVGQGALDRLRKDGEFKPVFDYKLNNITDYETSIRQLLGTLPANTGDRIDFRNQAIADIQTKNRELFSEQISNDNEELRTQLGIISEQYEVYKKIYKLTADSGGAMSIAFGGGMATRSYSDYLKAQMKKILPAHNLNTGLSYSLDDVLKMSQSQYDSLYGKNNSRFSILFKAYKDEQEKLKTETIKMIADVIEKNSTLEQQLEDINTEYEYQLGLIQAQEDLTPDMKKRAEEGLKKTRDDKTASVKFEIFKRNSDWVAIFDDLDRVSTNTINSMIDKIDNFSKTAGLSVEVVKQLRDALDKLRNESMDRNPFDALFNATSRGNAIGNLISDNASVLNNGGSVKIDAATAKKTGLIEGQSYNKTELENAQTSAYEDFPSALNAITNKFKALGDVLNPVLDLFEALGMEDNPLAQGMGLATNALGAASGVAGGLKALGLESAGPYGAAIGAGLSIVSGLFAMHDKALQKEIEDSERRQREMENLTKNLKASIESTLGGIYSYKVSADTRKQINSIVKEYERDQRLLSRGGLNAIFAKGTYSNETYQQALKAQKSGTAYDAELTSLMAQKDELVKQRQAEEDKKNTDADAIQNYNQQIKEMEQSIDDFAQTFLNDIYNIDIKSWASQLTDSIVEAWAKGEDAAEAYHDKVQELVKDLTKNILSQKIMEIALQPVLTDLENLLKSKGKLDESDIPGIADQLIKAGDTAIESITDILDALKERGLDLSENGSLSVSNSIKSITEDTADLLASYLNAIRLDVSVNRENLRLILVAVQSVPELNNIARSQLTQLTTLVTLAEARNSKLDDMYSWMNKVTNGVLKISMK